MNGGKLPLASDRSRQHGFHFSFGIWPLSVARLKTHDSSQISEDLAEPKPVVTRETFGMPYYLVTHTSLVEGDDELKAAEKVLAKLQSERSLQFLVKSDEVTSRTVTVVNEKIWQVSDHMRRSSLAPGPEPGVTRGPDKSSEAESPVLTRSFLTPRNIAIATGLFTVGLLLGVVIG